MSRRIAWDNACGGVLLHVGGMCRGALYRYRRQAKSFGVPFMTSALLCGSHHKAISWWSDAERVPFEAHTTSEAIGSR